MDKKLKQVLDRAAKESDKHRENYIIALRRVGDTPEQKLKWLLNFKDQNLAYLSRGEREMVGECLRVLPASMLLYGGTVSFDIQWEHVSEPLADDDLSGLQQWTKDLFAAQGDDRAREFKLPVPSEAFLHRQSPLTSKKSRFQYIEKYELEHELRAITKGIANIILAASGNLRFCLECRRLFVASRKRVYCSDRCSQRVQDRKRPPDRKVKKRKKN